MLPHMALDSRDVMDVGQLQGAPLVGTLRGGVNAAQRAVTACLRKDARGTRHLGVRLLFPWLAGSARWACQHAPGGSAWQAYSGCRQPILPA